MKLLCLFQFVCLLCSCEPVLCRPAAAAKGEAKGGVHGHRASGQGLVFHKHVSSTANQDHDGAKITDLTADKSRKLDDGGQQNFRGMEADLPSLEKALDASNGNDTNTTKFYELSWFDGLVAGVGLLLIIILILAVFLCVACCYSRGKCRCRKFGRSNASRIGLEFEDSMEWSENGSLTHHRVQRTKRQLGDSEEDEAVQFFLNANHQSYQFEEKLNDLGSRVQKNWYIVKSVEEEEEYMMLTVAPVSGNCPLQLHKYQKGLNKLLQVLKLHPFIHPIVKVEYLVDHKFLLMIQPQRYFGSLKDLIYNVNSCTSDWSKKYSHPSRGLAKEKVQLYGRQVLEAMKFLYGKHFPMLGHIHSGNVFVLEDTCYLGGYENTLLGYRTRLYSTCKGHLNKMDVILFGHLIYEMCAGRELTGLSPGPADFKAVPKTMRPILEYIFEEGFPHSISEISCQDFFNVPLEAAKGFDPASIQLTDSMKRVLEKVRKGKPRTQKMPLRHSIEGELAPSSWKDRFHIPKHFLFGQKRGREKFPGGEALSPEIREPLLPKGELSWTIVQNGQ